MTVHFQPAPTRRFRKLAPAPKAHPFTKTLYAAMNEKQVGVVTMAERSGVNKNTIGKWRTRDVPQIEGLRACLQVVGLELRIVPIGAKLHRGAVQSESNTWPAGAVTRASYLWCKGVGVFEILEDVMGRYPHLDEVYTASDSGFITVRRQYPSLFPKRAALAEHEPLIFGGAA